MLKSSSARNRGIRILKMADVYKQTSCIFLEPKDRSINLHNCRIHLRVSYVSTYFFEAIYIYVDEFAFGLVNFCVISGKNDNNAHLTQFKLFGVTLPHRGKLPFLALSLLFAI